MARVDTDGEWFELDFGGRRFTHYPSGDTCLRQPYMNGPSFGVWEEKFRTFLARHPDCRVVADSRRMIIDDVRRHSLAGGGFAVGETVVVCDRIDRTPLRALRIVATETFQGDDMYRTPGDDPKSHVLENGTTLFWDQDFNGWFVADVLQDATVRARAPLPGEDLEALSPTASDILLVAIPEVARRLGDIGNGWHLSRLFGDDEGRELADLRTRLAGCSAKLDAARAALVADGDGNPDPSETSIAYAQAYELILELTERAETRSIDLGVLADWGLGDLATRVPVVLDALRERGNLPSSDPEETSSPQM